MYTVSQALCAATRDALEGVEHSPGDISPNRMFAHVKLNVVCRYNPVTFIPREARVQLRFWEAILRMDLSDKMVCFSVSDVACLQRADGQYAQFVDLDGNRRRGCVLELNQLECADGLRCLRRRRAATSWAIRIPAPYAVLLAKERWTHVMIPDVRAAGGGEIRSMMIPWQQLGVPCPAVVRRMWQEGVASLDGSALQDIADFLRRG